MKILFIGLCTFCQNPTTNKFDILPGGTEHVNHSLLTELCKHDDWSISYLTQTCNSKCREFYKTIYRLDLCARYTNKYLDNLMKCKNYDLVIFSGILMGPSVDILDFFLNNANELPPIIIFTHGFNVLSTRKIKSCFTEYPISYKMYFISSYKPEYEYFQNLSKGHAYRFKYPIQELDAHTVNSEKELNNIMVNKNNRALYIARIFPHKGIENAIDICSKMGFDLDIYGRTQDEDYFNYLKDYPRECKIRFMGSINHKELCSKIKNYSIAFHLPNHQEGGSLSCKEIMLSGTQLVTWDYYKSELGEKSDTYPNVLYLPHPDKHSRTNYDVFTSSSMVKGAMEDFYKLNNRQIILNNIAKLYKSYNEDQFSESITNLVNSIISK